MPGRLAFLEHTADVGIDVVAADLPDLFRTAARGMFELLMGGDRVESGAAITTSPATRHLTLSAPDTASLLVDWLRELLFWHETDALCFTGATFDTLSEQLLDAMVASAPCPGQPVREIKGVTYHQLMTERQDRAWHARVIFDV